MWLCVAVHTRVQVQAEERGSIVAPGTGITDCYEWLDIVGKK